MQTLTHRSCARSLRRAACAALLVIALSSFAVPGAAVSAMVPDGAWFIDGTGAAVQIFDCSGLLCGRIIWLEKARDTAGRLARDDKNPDPIFRQRPLCGLTVIQGLQPAGPRPLEQRLALQPGGRADIPRLGRTPLGRCIRRADISGRAALRRDQDLAAGFAAQVGRMVLAPLEPWVAEAAPPQSAWPRAPR